MKYLVALALAGLAAACSTTVTSPLASTSATVPAAPLLSTRYVWACHSWGPVGPPPVARTVFDILLPGAPPDFLSTDPKAFAAVVAAGGRLIYTFHSSLYRFELDVPAVSQLAAQGYIPYARSVRSLDDFVVPFFGEFNPPASDADIVNVVSAGGFQLTVNSFTNETLIGGFVDDSHWAQLSALPFKLFGLNLPLFCAE